MGCADQQFGPVFLFHHLKPPLRYSCQWNQRLIHGQRVLLHKLLECAQPPPDLVRKRTFPVSVSNILWYTHTESIFTCSTLPCHWRAKLMPFNTVSSSAKLICWASASGCSQQASSNTVSRHSKTTPQLLGNWHRHIRSALCCPHTNPYRPDHPAEQILWSRTWYAAVRCLLLHHPSPLWPNLLASWVFHRPHEANHTRESAWQVAHTRRILFVM